MDHIEQARLEARLAELDAELAKTQGAAVAAQLLIATMLESRPDRAQILASLPKDLDLLSMSQREGYRTWLRGITNYPAQGEEVPTPYGRGVWVDYGRFCLLLDDPRMGDGEGVGPGPDDVLAIGVPTVANLLGVTYDQLLAMNRAGLLRYRVASGTPEPDCVSARLVTFITADREAHLTISYRTPA